MSDEEGARVMSDRCCTFCGEATNDLHGNPQKWALWFTDPDGTGIVRAHHVGCVQDRLKIAADVINRQNQMTYTERRNDEFRRSEKAAGRCGDYDCDDCYPK